MMTFLYNLDLSLFRWVNAWAAINPFFDFMIVFRATYAIYIIGAAALAFPVATALSRFRQFRAKNVEFFCFSVVSVVVARVGIAELIKIVIARSRPLEVLPNVSQLVFNESGKSFPSGHATIAFALATAVAYYYPKTSILFFLAALSIGGARVSAGIHWPSDIVGGALIGITATVVLRYLFKKWQNSRKEKTAQ